MVTQEKAGSPTQSVPRLFSWRWLLLVLVLLALTAGIAQSQLAVGRVELVMQAGHGGEAAIGVRNESDRPVQAIVRLEDWDRAQDGSNRWYAYGTNAGRGSCAPALSIFPQALRLEPGAEQAIRVGLDRAKAPRSGECWAAAVVETVQPGERPGQRVTYVVRTAVKIYVQSAQLVAEGEIDGLKVVDDSTATDGQQSVELEFSNTGTSHVVAKGVIEVRKPDNSTVHRIPMPTIYALPGAKHAVRVRMPELAPGDYVVLATMDYGGPDIAAAWLEHRRK